MSPPEALLWQQLRKRPSGLKFRRQHPVDPYVVDFYCREAALVVEIDGYVHGTEEAHLRDKRRDARLMEKGLTVLRIPAGEVMHDCGSAVAAILERAGSPLHQPLAGPPPRPGEDI
ncbi:MAG TPA: endonuclease domain-containing protein [Allosphingosinicella sp.]|nr:endonuclease domain-containing protein [Allosphingosinicella sp.]